MGNEESQQGGAPGQPPQSQGGTFGMGAPAGQPRFGGPQMGGAPPRQVAPTGRPNLRPGGPGPPQPAGLIRAAFSSGAGTVLPQRQQQQPVRPVQVGVQPWAEPPVQQPPQFRGPQPAGVPLRPPLQQQQQQQAQAKAQAAAKQQAMMAQAESEMDLTGLSEEERNKILSVMARAQDMDQDYERHKRAKEDPVEVRPQLLCPLCQAVDLAVETNKCCGDCGKDFCQKCGTFVPGEGRRSVWVCNTCSNRRKQLQSASMTTQHQDTTTYTTATGQKVAGDPGRKDETMSRMGQPFQSQQQATQQAMMVQPGGQQQVQQVVVVGQQQQQPSVSLLGGTGTGGTSGGASLMSGSLIPSSAVGRGGSSLPGTVPLTAVSQQQQWQPQAQQQWTMQQQPTVQQQSKGGMEGMTAQQQPQASTGSGLMTSLMRKGVESSEWSPVTDLSPIMDVSPSLEAAEQELMEKCSAEQQQSSLVRPSIPRAQSGTISSLLADFNKSVGQTTPTIDDVGGQQRSLAVAPQQKTVMAGGTEMDQNQNLVQQHQFQLQQQQLMIQQQQQVIQQQQQQLQMQQMQQQQQQMTATQQQMTLQQQQDMQQQPQTILQQQQPGVVMGGATPLQQQQQTPSQRKDPHLQQQEVDGDKKVRRRLPPVPLDQEPTTVPLRRTKDRNRTLSMPLSTSADRGVWDTRRMPQRTTSLDDGMSLTKALGSGSSILDSLGLSSSSTDTYLRLLAARDLAGLFGTTTAGVSTTTASILDSIPSSIGLTSTSLLGRRDLSAPHSLSLYRDGIPPTSTASYLLDSTDPGPKLPSYILSLKQQLREELRSVSDHNRRRITDPDLSGLLSHSTWPSDAVSSSTSTFDPLRKLGSSTLPLTSGSRMAAGTRRSRHRRHASDTKLSMFTSLGAREDLGDDPLSRYKLYQGGSTMPFKSYEFESIDDHLGPSYGYQRTHYPRRSSLTDMRTSDELRDTAVTTTKDPAALRRYNREMARLRRHTDTGLGSLSLSGLDPYGRHHHHWRGIGGLSRSWHPSPYVSEDEDEREEKKAKIKAEIARRRQHLEESARLQHHDPMYKVTRTSANTAGYSSPLWSGDRLYSSPVSLDEEELLMMRRREDAYTRNHNYAYPPTSYRSSNTNRYADSNSWPYDPYAYADDLADPYDMVMDYSPVLDPPLDSEGLVAPMPLLPDMPTRSRRLLHDLGSTPLNSNTTSTRHRQVSQQPYDEYEGRGGIVEDHHPHHHRSSRPPPPRSSENLRKAQQNQSKTSQKYDFPVKRILLTRDPKDRSVSGNGLGMKVVGGKEIPGSNGMIGAYVARIYPGGVVETLGEVREGDQVLEWNGTSLTGKTYEEVQRIIATSGDEVEIVIRSDFNMLSSRTSSHHHHPNRHHHHEQQNHHHHSESRHRHQSRSGGSTSYQQQQQHHQQQQQQQSGSYRTSRGYEGSEYLRSPTEEGRHSNSNCVDYPDSASPSRGYGSPSRHPRIGSPVGKADTSDNKEKYRAEDISGEIQLQVCYDSKASILYVTIVRARNLVTSRDNSGLPDPYVKCYLLPDRRVENQRRTRYFSRCSDPEWKQTMVYPQVPQDQLRKKHLEISVWNYDINRPPEFLGEVILDLKDTSVIDEQSRWYKLHPHDPKKYPSQSLVNNEGANVKMARLNNPANHQKAANYHHLDSNDPDAIRKPQHTA